MIATASPPARTAYLAKIERYVDFVVLIAARQRRRDPIRLRSVHHSASRMRQGPGCALTGLANGRRRRRLGGERQKAEFVSNRVARRVDAARRRGDDRFVLRDIENGRRAHLGDDARNERDEKEERNDEDGARSRRRLRHGLLFRLREGAFVDSTFFVGFGQSESTNGLRGNRICLLIRASRISVNVYVRDT